MVRMEICKRTINRTMMMMRCLGIKMICKMVNSNRKIKEKIRTNKNNKPKKTIIPNNKRIPS